MLRRPSFFNNLSKKAQDKVNSWIPEKVHNAVTQQQYRDYIDLVKMAQLVPVMGAPVGVIVNYRLIRKLGNTAMNAYRMRLQDSTV